MIYHTMVKNKIVLFYQLSVLTDGGAMGGGGDLPTELQWPLMEGYLTPHPKKAHQFSIGLGQD